MDIKINPQEIPAIVTILKELIKGPIIVPAEPEEETIVQNTETADEQLAKCIMKKLEDSQVKTTDGLINDILPTIEKEVDEFINLIRLKQINMADYKAMKYAAAARKAKQSIAVLTNTKEDNECLNDFVKALEAACLNMTDTQKDLMFKGLGETCKKDPIVFLGSYYSAIIQSKAAEKEADKNKEKENLPRESTEHDEIFRLFYRFIEDVDNPQKVDFEDPITYELDNYKNHYSPYRVNIDMSEDTRILFAVERLVEKKGYYSNMKVAKDLFCFRFQFVDGDLKRVYMTDNKFDDIKIANESITALIGKLEKAVEDFKPEVIIHEVDEHNVHL